MLKDSPSKILGISLFLIATICVAIFFPTLNYGWLSIEDTTYYGSNPLFGSAPFTDRLQAAWTIAPESNYMPLTWSFTILLSKLTSHSASAFHLSSLLLHTINGCLAFLLLRRFQLSTVQALIIALLFTIHPLRAESVAWASSLKGLLAGCFTLLTLLIQTSKNNKVTHFKTPLVILFFLFSLLCKQTLFMLPVVIFLIARYKSEFKIKTIGYLALAALSVSAAVTASLVNADNPMLTIHQFNDGQLSPLKGLAALGHYIQQHLIPNALIPEYPRSNSVLLMAIAIIGLSPLCLWLRHLKSTDKHPSIALVFYTSFIVLLLPILGFITSPLEFAADRLTYIPSLFFWTACVLSIYHFLPTKYKQSISLTLSSLALVLFSFLSIKQVAVWQNDHSLTDHILEHEPEHFLANLQISNKLASNGDFRTALEHAITLIQAHPHRYAGWQTFTRIHMSTGSANVALTELEQALSKETPITSGLHLLRIEALRSLKRYEEAQAAADTALNAGADAATVHYHKSLTYFKSGDLIQAHAQIKRALELNPNAPAILALEQEINSQ